MDELPIGRVGVVIAVAPERELDPRALALDPANRDTAKAVLDSTGLKPQAQDGAAQAVGVGGLKEQAMPIRFAPKTPRAVARDSWMPFLVQRAAAELKRNKILRQEGWLMARRHCRRKRRTDRFGKQADRHGTSLLD